VARTVSTTVRITDDAAAVALVAPAPPPVLCES
jgi:hypothetical protein